MKSMHIKKSQKKLYWSIAVAVTVGIAVAAAYYARPSHTSSPNISDSGVDMINLDKPTDAQIQDGADTKKASIDKDAQSKEQPSASQTITATLNAQQNGSQVVFDTLIQGAYGQGTCTLTVTSGSKTATKTADMFANPSTSSCRGFSVQTSELPAGTWKASLSLLSNDKTGQATTALEVR